MGSIGIPIKLLNEAQVGRTPLLDSNNNKKKKKDRPPELNKPH